MTISKAKLEELALEVANTQYEDDFHKWPQEYTQRVMDFALALIRRVEAELEQDAPAHMFPWDLEKFDEAETFATAYSIPVGSPDGKSVPLVSLPLVSEE